MTALHVLLPICVFALAATAYSQIRPQMQSSPAPDFLAYQGRLYTCLIQRRMIGLGMTEAGVQRDPDSRDCGFAPSRAEGKA
ncbi:MAG: hypothetical protein WB359_16610, partial [Bryobacteraceae bacterium]